MDKSARTVRYCEIKSSSPDKMVPHVDLQGADHARCRMLIADRNNLNSDDLYHHDPDRQGNAPDFTPCSYSHGATFSCPYAIATAPLLTAADTPGENGVNTAPHIFSLRVPLRITPADVLGT